MTNIVAFKINILLQNIQIRFSYTLVRAFLQSELRPLCKSSLPIVTVHKSYLQKLK